MHRTMGDPIPNELDIALAQLIPAVTTCGDPKGPSYRDLAVFESMVGTAPAWVALTLAAQQGQEGGGGRRVLDARVAGEVVVAFRQCMHEAAMSMAGVGGAGRGTGKAEQEGGVTEPLETSRALGIMTLALDFVSQERKAGTVHSTLSGLPLVLLEDFFDSQGRETCKEFWAKCVEPNSASMMASVVGGRYRLIRLCKKLAQRMSKARDSSFCGQMHIFMSKALEFSERSGLNVSGAVNLDNVTAFEDEEQFRRSTMGFDGEKEALSAGAGGGPANGASDDAMDTNAEEGEKVKDTEEFAVNYELYRSFWRMQDYALKQDAAVKGDAAKETWSAILDDVDKILGAFEGNAFSEHDLRLAREKWMAASTDRRRLRGDGNPAVGSKRRRPSSGGDNDASVEMHVDGGDAGGRGKAGGYFGLKYLTSSRLLRLQLRDPTLRLQVLTQWLILAASLKSKVGKDTESPNSAADLNPRIERAKRLVRTTPPRGEEYLNMLQTVLNRESAWTQWKDVRKCGSVEPVAVAEEAAAAAAAAAGVVLPAPSFPNKRQRPPASVAATERAKYAPLGADFPLEQMVTKLRGGIPTAEEHLEDQRLCAEDPHTPASELPSASPLYTWRALRLLGFENPANLAGCYDGDLVKAMARLDKANSDEEAKAAEAAAEEELVPEGPKSPPTSPARRRRKSSGSPALRSSTEATTVEAATDEAMIDAAGAVTAAAPSPVAVEAVTDAAAMIDAAGALAVKGGEMAPRGAAGVEVEAEVVEAMAVDSEEAEDDGKEEGEVGAPVAGVVAAAAEVVGGGGALAGDGEGEERVGVGVSGSGKGSEEDGGEDESSVAADAVLASPGDTAGRPVKDEGTVAAAAAAAFGDVVAACAGVDGGGGGRSGSASGVVAAETDDAGEDDEEGAVIVSPVKHRPSAAAIEIATVKVPISKVAKKEVAKTEENDVAKKEDKEVVNKEGSKKTRVAKAKVTRTKVARKLETEEEEVGEEGKVAKTKVANEKSLKATTGWMAPATSVGPKSPSAGSRDKGVGGGRGKASGVVLSPRRNTRSSK